MTPDSHPIDSIVKGLHNNDQRAIARAITLIENGGQEAEKILSSLNETLLADALVLGITGPPGAGKSTLANQLISWFRRAGKRVGVIAIDPSSSISRGALLGDRIRMMGHALDNDVIVRSMATRGRLGGLCAAAGAAANIMAAAGCSIVIIETVGVGQSELDIVQLADITLLVMAPGLGDDIQAMKAGLLEVADVIVVNKADARGADTLAMEMENMGRDTATTRPIQQTHVCKTIASEGKGIEELAALLGNLDLLHRKEGIRSVRREQKIRSEILDWAIELLRPHLIKKIDDIVPSGTVVTRQIAKKLMEKCLTTLL